MKTFRNWRDIPEDFTGICKRLDYNAIFYYKNGLPHREDGPAIIYENGNQDWWLNGLQHRESGPSDEYTNGDKFWFYKDKLYGTDDDFTNTTWINKVQELKREEQLKIFI